MARFSPTIHAVQRARERMVPEVSMEEAAQALEEFLATGCHRPTPRRWTARLARDFSAVSFVYNARRPGVVALISGGKVITVLSRALRPLPKERPAPSTRRRRGRLVPAERFAWNGILEVEA